ncbi:hypothetical protein Nans01_00250 [Nocardiopsis ansamitocini]|uniref:Uncharacterized protein n=1 Tax=Nocardiopsis ansamitocini TaxID=1670832 RepID=A0A9W6P1W4_9ACTN|nr:hypothetical protein Nans01_00250 [Nocardiopsis ansamitocini]
MPPAVEHGHLPTTRQRLVGDRTTDELRSTQYQKSHEGHSAPDRSSWDRYLLSADPPRAEAPVPATTVSGPGGAVAVRGGVSAPPRDDITNSDSGTAVPPTTLTDGDGEHVVVDGQKPPAGSTPVGGSIPRPVATAEAERGGAPRSGWGAPGRAAS